MAKFRGYFPIDADFTDFSYFPTDILENDSVVGVYTPDVPPGQPTPFKLGQLFRATEDAEVLIWVAEEEPQTIESATPNFIPFAERALNVYEPYGLGLYSMFYAYVDISSIPTWGNVSKVGQTVVARENITFHNVFTGDEVEVLPDTIGLLPVYVKSGDVVVGVGSATFLGVWRILWYKMGTTSGAPPSVLYDMETILDTLTFKMRGNTSAYKLIVTESDWETTAIVEGEYVEPFTTYSLAAYPDRDFHQLMLVDQIDNPVFIMTNALHPGFTSLSEDWSAFSNSISVSLEALDTKDGTLIPRNIVGGSSGFVSRIYITNSTGRICLRSTVINLNTGVESDPSVEMSGVTLNCDGIFTKEQYEVLTAAYNDISFLKGSAGKWIGQNFATHADLVAFSMPNGYEAGWYTYVLADEVNGIDTVNGNVRTIYAVVAYDEDDPGIVVNDPLEEFGIKFSRKDNQPAVEIATTEEKGLVKSSAETNKISVDINGIMSVNGYDAVLNRISLLESQVAAAQTGLIALVAALQTGKEDSYSDPAAGPLHDKTLSAALSYLNDVIQGLTAVKINHIE